MLKNSTLTLCVRTAYAILVLAFILTVFSGCKKSSEEDPGTVIREIKKITFRDIPGITQSDIIDIEVLRKSHASFVYGVNPSIEAFNGKDGELQGYAVMFCDWLSEMFGIQFKPVYYQWGDLLRGLESGEIDFTGEVMIPSTTDQARYFMTSPTIHRTIKTYQLQDSTPLEEIIQYRNPRYAFLSRTVVFADIAANTAYDFETITVDSHDEAYRMLKSGEADAFFGLDTAEGTFDIYGDVVSEEFFPLVFRSACLSTQKEELLPIITVLEKALDTRVLKYLTDLQDSGYQIYRENKVYAQLTEEERLYIQNNPVIKISADFSNYPISFYSRSNKWEGIYFEALDEVSKLTGLTFEIGNDQNMQLLELVKRVEEGEMLILPELHQTKEYEDRFLWSEVPIVTDHFAFISKANLRNIGVNDVFHLHVAIRKGTIYNDIFKGMFPSHENFTEYETMEDTWEALRKGEVDIIFCSQRRLIIYTNYYEQSDFKLNLVFDHTFDSFLTYNKDAVILKSIIDKALGVININNITNQWIYRTYDYRNKMAAAQRPFLIGASILSVFVLMLVLILLVRSRTIGKQLEIQVEQRTRDLAFETSKLYAIFDSIPDFMFCKNTKLKYTQCNDSFEQFMGVSEADFVGKSNKDGGWFSPDEMAMIHSTDKAVINENKKYIIEEKIRSPITGKKGIFETVKAPIRQDGAVVGIVAIVRDITQRKEMEEELIASSRAKTSFLAHMSHELRTPLNVVIGLTDLILEDDGMSSHVRDNLIKIGNAGSTLLSIVNDILDFSKIESGKLTLSPIEYHISSLLNDIVTLVITRLGEKPVTFRLNIDDDLPYKLFGDDLRVKQILTNLLTNAIKYTRDGSIELRVRCTREGDTVWMDAAVTDTGMGIPEDDMKNLFLDYYQVIANANRYVEGTGLGLPITKSLVEMMDGEIKVESEYGKGSTFSFRIKQGFVNNKTIGADVSEKLRTFCYSDDKRIAHRKLIRIDLSYARVLVVDDMQTNLDVASSLLRRYKMEVDCLTSGPVAIERIRAGTPVYNAIFMDHMMPLMDGIETADRIRALGTKYAQKIPIIALTANAIQGTEKMFYAHDFQAFLTKPIDVLEMDKVLMKYVRDDTRESVPVSDDSSSGDETENMVIEIPGVDTQKGLSLYVGDTKVYLPLLRSYAANTPGVLEKLRTVSAENLSDYVITVHGLKGTSAGIGAEEIRQAAFELEQKSRAGDLQGVLEKNDKLIADTEIIVANVKAWLEKNDVKKAKPRLKAPDRELLARLRQCCVDYDIDGIEEVMSQLESSDYEEDAELITWIREKIDISKMGEVAKRLA